MLTQDYLLEISFLTTLLSLILLRPFAIKFKLIDLPTDRKKHYGEVPFIGGVCIYIGFIICQIYLNQSYKNIKCQ